MSEVDQFLGEIQNTGLTPPGNIIPDGKLHRFASNGRRGDDAGWYVDHGDSIQAGAFGDWRTGFPQIWSADIGRRLTHAEEIAHRAKLKAMKREREDEEANRRSEAATIAGAIWNAAKPAPDDQPYLTGKRIKAHGARLDKDAPVIPLQKGSKLHSLQFIDPDGEKRFLPADGCRKFNFCLSFHSALSP